MELDNILSYILTFLTGGGALSLVTWRFTKKEAEASAMEKVQNVYQQLIEDILSDRTRLKERVDRLESQVRDNAEALAALQPWLCYRLRCREGRLSKSETKTPTTNDTTQN